jgi:uncharacterized membrane protein
MIDSPSKMWSQPVSRRALAVIIVVFSVLLLGFYTVTDIDRLENHTILDGADYVGYSICHRITDRSFSIAGRQLPLCARCTGIYLGVMAPFTVFFLAGRRRWIQMPPLRIILFLGLLISLMAIDGLNSYSHFFENTPRLYEPKNWLRLITGSGAGLAMGIVLFPAVAQTLWRNQVNKSPVSTLRELFGLFIVLAVLIVLVLSGQPTLLYLLGIASATGVVLVLTSVNVTLLLIMIKRDAQASRIRQALLPLSFGLLLALIEIGIISIIRYNLTGTLAGLPGL